MSLARKLATLLVSSGAAVDPSVGGAPAGVVLPYAGSAAPTGWLLCYGQAVNRTTYAALFAAIGTNYGTGDGSTTFNLPDMRGRVAGGKDDMGGSAANRLTTAGSGVNGATLGAAGGAETHTLSVAQMPAHSHAVSGATSPGGSGSNDVRSSGNATGSAPTTASQGSGNAHNNTQPTLVLQYIIKT